MMINVAVSFRLLLEVEVVTNTGGCAEGSERGREIKMLRVARMGLRYGPCLLISDGGVGEGGRTATVTGKSHLTIASQSSDQIIVFALLL